MVGMSQDHTRRKGTAAASCRSLETILTHCAVHWPILAATAGKQSPATVPEAQIG